MSHSKTGRFEFEHEQLFYGASKAKTHVRQDAVEIVLFWHFKVIPMLQMCRIDHCLIVVYCVLILSAPLIASLSDIL